MDLGNAVSLRHFLPIGAHDLGTIPEGLEVRPAVEGDFFLPFGGEGMETPDAGEIVYVSEHQVRTRRWTWRSVWSGFSMCPARWDLWTRIIPGLTSSCKVNIIDDGVCEML